MNHRSLVIVVMAAVLAAWAVMPLAAPAFINHLIDIAIFPRSAASGLERKFGGAVGKL